MTKSLSKIFSFILAQKKESAYSFVPTFSYYNKIEILFAFFGKTYQGEDRLTGGHSQQFKTDGVRMDKT
jgi:hypothetical protein